MKLRRLFASLISACVAISAMTVVSSAVDTTDYMREGDTLGTVYVLADKEADPNWSADTGIAPTDVYGVTYHVEFNADEVADEAAWIGGGMGANSQSTGWKQIEWGRNEKEIIADLENGTITWLSDAPIFAEGDTYCQFWLQAWGGTVTIKSADILGADGVVLSAAAEEAPADDAAAGAYTAEIGYNEVASFKVTDDVTEIVAKIACTPAGDGFDGMNDWCGEGVVVTLEDGTKAYYQFGGAQVNWGWDATGDTVEDSVGGVAGETWLGAFADNAVELTIPVAKNAVVEIYCLSWDSYEGTQLTVTVDGGVEAYEAPAAEEETTEEDDAAAEEETEEDTADDDAAIEPDWDSYDADAMAAMNEEFVLGGNIDIYSAVGDDWAEIAVIEADFVWTPGLGGWCGGAGIGNGAVAADGSTWISGPEYGAANANSSIEPDGKATQVVVDLSANPLTAIASVGEDGTTVFAQLMVQNWWNGVEAGAQVAAIRFLAADGTVLGELTYDVEAPAVEEAPEVEEAPATGDVDAETDSSKGSPDTGVEDVAVVAGLAIVAAGAVLVSKKRK